MNKKSLLVILILTVLSVSFITACDPPTINGSGKLEYKNYTAGNYDGVKIGLFYSPRRDGSENLSQLGDVFTGTSTDTNFTITGTIRSSDTYFDAYAFLRIGDVCYISSLDGSNASKFSFPIEDGGEISTVYNVGNDAYEYDGFNLQYAYTTTCPADMDGF